MDIFSHQSAQASPSSAPSAIKFLMARRHSFVHVSNFSGCFLDILIQYFIPNFALVLFIRNTLISWGVIGIDKIYFFN